MTKRSAPGTRSETFPAVHTTSPFRGSSAWRSLTRCRVSATALRACGVSSLSLIPLLLPGVRRRPPWSAPVYPTFRLRPLGPLQVRAPHRHRALQEDEDEEDRAGDDRGHLRVDPAVADDEQVHQAEDERPDGGAQDEPGAAGEQGAADDDGGDRVQLPPRAGDVLGDAEARGVDHR